MMENDLEKILKYNRFPIYVNLQLTYRCNCKCLHCYQTPIKDFLDKELDFDEWRKILDILKDNKTMIIHFTGGEVFVRNDFIKIYEYAYDKNFKIMISTNASLIDDKWIELFKRKKSYKVAITLYGMSESTYKKFTKNNALEKVYINILNLNKNGIEIFLKTIGNIYNKNELNQIYMFAKNFNIDFFAFFKIENYIKPINECMYARNLKNIMEKDNVY